MEDTEGVMKAISRSSSCGFVFAFLSALLTEGFIGVKGNNRI